MRQANREGGGGIIADVAATSTPTSRKEIKAKSRKLERLAAELNI